MSELLNIGQTWEEIFPLMVQEEKNVAWRRFAEAIQDEVKKRLKQSRQELTAENIKALSSEMLLNNGMPFMKYVHVFKCGRCDNWHETRVAAHVLYAEEDETATGDDFGMSMKNVILAFGMLTEEGDGHLFMVRKDIKKLSVLMEIDPDSDDRCLVLVDPLMVPHLRTPGTQGKDPMTVITSSKNLH